MCGCFIELTHQHGGESCKPEDVLNYWQMETLYVNQVLVSIVVAGELVLKCQVISIHNDDLILSVPDQSHKKILIRWAPMAS